MLLLREKPEMLRDLQLEEEPELITEVLMMRKRLMTMKNLLRN